MFGAAQSFRGLPNSTAAWVNLCADSRLRLPEYPHLSLWPFFAYRHRTWRVILMEDEMGGMISWLAREFDFSEGELRTSSSLSFPDPSESSGKTRSRWLERNRMVYFVSGQCPMRSTTRRWTAVLTVLSNWWFLPPSRPGQSSHARMSKSLISPGVWNLSATLTRFSMRSCPRCGRCHM